jgi:hypothetical protein
MAKEKPPFPNGDTFPDVSGVGAKLTKLYEVMEDPAGCPLLAALSDMTYAVWFARVIVDLVGNEGTEKPMPDSRLHEIVELTKVVLQHQTSQKPMSRNRLREFVEVTKAALEEARQEKKKK